MAFGDDAGNDIVTVAPVVFVAVTVMVRLSPGATEPRFTSVGWKFSPGKRSTLFDTTHRPESPSPRLVPLSGVGRTLRP